MLKKVAKVVLDVLLSPQARRYEIPLVLMVYEAVRAALGTP